MDARTFAENFNPILAVTATPRYKRERQEERQQRKSAKKPSPTVFQLTPDTEDYETETYIPGYYGKDAKPVTKNTSHFYIKL